MNSYKYTYNDCISWNRQGVFALPEDTQETYEEKISQKNSHKICTPQNSPSPLDTQAFFHLKELYDVEPAWVSVVYSNEGLNFFEAGCTWIEGNNVWVQLKKIFKNRKTLFSIYQKSEVLAHEYVHAVRSPLKSDKYEEFFAYFVSKKFGASFRAFFGPLFSSPQEVQSFVWAWMLPLFAMGLELFGFINNYFFITLVSFPLFLSAFFGARLLVRWKRWHSLAKKLGLSLMVRLMDEEIDFFSALSKDEISLWIEKAKGTSFRWKLLADCYCKQFIAKQFQNSVLG